MALIEKEPNPKLPEIGLLMQDWDKLACACPLLGLAKPQLGPQLRD